MDRWIKIKESQLMLILKYAHDRIKEKIISEHIEEIIDLSHFLRINQNKIKATADNSDFKTASPKLKHS